MADIIQPIINETATTFLKNPVKVSYDQLATNVYFSIFSGLSEDTTYGHSTGAFYLQWKTLCVLPIIGADHITANIKGPASADTAITGLTSFSSTKSAIFTNLKGLTAEQREELEGYESWKGYFIFVTSGTDQYSLYRIDGFNPTYDLFTLKDPLNNDISDDSTIEVVQLISSQYTWEGVALYSFDELQIYLNSLDQKGILGYPTGDVDLTPHIVPGFEVKYAVLEDRYLREKKLSEELNKVKSYNDLLEQDLFKLNSIKIATEPDSDLWAESLIQDIYFGDTSIELTTAYTFAYDDSQHKVTLAMDDPDLIENKVYYVRYSNGLVFLAIAESTTSLSYIWENLIGIDDNVAQQALVSPVKHSIISKKSTYKNVLRLMHNKAIPIGLQSIIEIHTQNINVVALTVDATVEFSASGTQQIKIFEAGNESNVYGYVAVSPADLQADTFDAFFSYENTVYRLIFDIATVDIKLLPHDAQVDLVEEANESNVIATLNLPGHLIFGNLKENIKMYTYDIENTHFVYNEHAVIKLSLANSQFKIIDYRKYRVGWAPIDFVNFKDAYGPVNMYIQDINGAPLGIKDANFNNASTYKYLQYYYLDTLLNYTSTDDAVLRATCLLNTHNNIQNHWNVQAYVTSGQNNFAHTVVTGGMLINQALLDIASGGPQYPPSQSNVTSGVGQPYYSPIVIGHAYGDVSYPYTAAHIANFEIPKSSLSALGLLPGSYMQISWAIQNDALTYGLDKSHSAKAARFGNNIYAYSNYGYHWKTVIKGKLLMSARIYMGTALNYFITVQSQLEYLWPASGYYDWGIQSWGVGAGAKIDLNTGTAIINTGYGAGTPDVEYHNESIFDGTDFPLYVGTDIVSYTLRITHADYLAKRGTMTWTDALGRTGSFTCTDGYTHSPVMFGSSTKVNSMSANHIPIELTNFDIYLPDKVNGLASMRVVQTPYTSLTTSSNTTNPVNIKIPSGYQLLYLDIVYTYEGVDIDTSVTGIGNYIIFANLDPHTEAITAFSVLLETDPTLDTYGEYWVPIKTISV